MAAGGGIAAAGGGHCGSGVRLQGVIASAGGEAAWGRLWLGRSVRLQAMVWTEFMGFGVWLQAGLG